MLFSESLLNDLVERAEVSFISLGQPFEHIAATMIVSGHGNVTLPHRMQFEFRNAGRPDLFVRVNLNVRRMIDRQQADLIEVSRFPKFLRQHQTIFAIELFHAIAIDLEILPFARFRIDPFGKLQPNRSGPQTVGEEDPLLAVPRVKVRARTFQNLLSSDRLSRFRMQNVLRHAVRPNDPSGIDLFG